MRLSVMLEGQLGLAYDDLLSVARAAERLGFDGLYRSDHYATPDAGEALASTDAWATVAGLARDTHALTLGTLVSPVTFRPAGNLAKVVATVAEMAGTVDGRSRVELGVGAGWMEREHRSSGFAFPDLSTRFRLLEEHLQVIRGLWDAEQDPFSFAGEFEQLADAHFRPVPDPVPRIIVGGRGLHKTPRLAARYADELNTTHADPARCARMRTAMEGACADVGRDPASLPLSLMTGYCVGATDGAVRSRAERLRHRLGFDGTTEAFLERVGASWIVGTPGQAREQIGALEAVGVERIMLQHLLEDDVEALEIVAGEVQDAADAGRQRARRRT